MGNDYWYMRTDFLKASAKDILIKLLHDDRSNYERVDSEMRQDLILLDDAMILYLKVLQSAYGQIDKWKDNDSNRASMAMLASVFNYIILSRYGIMLGYYPEVRDLLRSCYERMTRSYLFYLDKDIARKFLNGEQIKQTAVDTKLSKYEKESDQRDTLFKSLRDYYKSISRVVHPNLESFDGRFGKEELDKKVGLNIVVGGLISNQLAHLSLMVLFQTIVGVLRILRVMISEQSSKWEEEYQKIYRSYLLMVDQVTAMKEQE